MGVQKVAVINVSVFTGKMMQNRVAHTCNTDHFEHLGGHVLEQSPLTDRIPLWGWCLICWLALFLPGLMLILKTLPQRGQWTQLGVNPATGEAYGTDLEFEVVEMQHAAKGRSQKKPTITGLMRPKGTRYNYQNIYCETIVTGATFTLLAESLLMYTIGSIGWHHAKSSAILTLVDFL